MLKQFYATVQPFRVECPRCGHLLIITGVQDRRGARRKLWNRHLSRLTCPDCRKVYVVGLLLWDVGEGWSPEGGIPQKAPPDTIPDRRILAELRKESGGFWAEIPLKAGGRAHRYVEASCTCHPAPWRESCPIHGVRGPELRESLPEVILEPGGRYWDTVRNKWVANNPKRSRQKPQQRQKEDEGEDHDKGKG